MGVCYNKLWKLLIDRKMKKKELLELSGISKAARKSRRRFTKRTAWS